MDFAWYLENKDRLFKDQPPYDPHAHWDFTLVGKRDGQKVWYRWKNGEITTNYPEVMEYLRMKIELAKKNGDLDRVYEYYHGQGSYFYQNLYTDPLTFRMILQRVGFHEFEGIEGDAPEPPKYLYE